MFVTAEHTAIALTPVLRTESRFSRVIPPIATLAIPVFSMNLVAFARYSKPTVGSRGLVWVEKTGPNAM